MAVFPENMDKLQTNDVPGSLSIIENYIRYMGERIEFSLRNVTKTVSAAGVSSAELYVLITAMGNKLSALQSTVNEQAGSLNTLSTKLDEMENELETINGAVSDLNEAVTALEARVEALESTET